MGEKNYVLIGCKILGLSTLITQFLIDAITFSNVFILVYVHFSSFETYLMMVSSIHQGNDVL